MKEQVFAMEGNSFSEDLITEIISRVPAKHLLRFTCVSKSWCSLIRTDPYLSRLQRSALLDRPCLFIEEIITLVSERKLFYNYWIDLDTIEDESIHIREIHNPFDHDEECPTLDARVIASYHGLLVFRQHRNRPRMIAVSNPITGEHVMVPPNPAGDGNVVFFGFGYDRVHDCYKLLTRVKYRDHSLELLSDPLELMVYDLDKGTWKRLQFGMWWKSLLGDRYDDSYNHYMYEMWDLWEPRCVDGAVYWCFNVELPRKVRMMVCFLLAEEEFHVLNPLDLGKVTDCYHHTLTVFDGKLGLMCQGLNTRHEFWSIGMVCDDDGKRQWQWTKLLSICDELDYFKTKCAIPVCYSACRNKILILSILGHQLFWYDIVKKEFDKLTNPMSGRCQEDQLVWYDIAKMEVHKVNTPVDGRCFDAKKDACVDIPGGI